MTRKNKKPKKPYPSFPLTAHPNGQWCKKIRGQVRFFGVWSDTESALDRYLAEAADLHAGRVPPRVATDGVTIKEATNAYLGWQKAKLDAGEIGPRWFEDCRVVLRDFARGIGVSRMLEDLRVEELQRHRTKLARRLGMHASSRRITVIKGMFKYAYETDLIDRPVKIGHVFQKPSAAQQRRARHRAEAENGKKLFGRRELRRILEASEDYLKAAVLLGVNQEFLAFQAARPARWRSLNSGAGCGPAPPPFPGQHPAERWGAVEVSGASGLQKKISIRRNLFDTSNFGPTMPPK